MAIKVYTPRHIDHLFRRILTTIRSLSEQHPSIPRSPLIPDVCFKGGFIDACGGGMLKIFNLTNAAGLPEPVIRVAHGEFMVRLCKSV